MTDSENKTSTTGKGRGAQGVDKAPGEEVAQDNAQFTQQTQKGKKNRCRPGKRKG